MVHEGQGLALRLEPGDDVTSVHTELDDLQGDLAPDRFLLFGHVDYAAAAFADLFQQLVTVDAVTRLLDSGKSSGRVWRDGRQKLGPILGGMQQRPDSFQQLRVTCADL